MATEYINTLKTSGGDYSSTATWEADIDGFSYTAATTKVFSHGGITGTIAAGNTVTGQTSGATGTVCSVVTSTQIMLGSITGTFSSGEVVQVTSGNSVTISDAGDSAIPVLECYAGTYSGSVTMAGMTTSTTNRLIIRAASGNKPTGIDTGVIFSVPVASFVLGCNGQAVTIEDICVSNGYSGIDNPGPGSVINRCYLYNTPGDTSVIALINKGESCNITNCHFDGGDGTVSSVVAWRNWISGTGIFANNTLSGFVVASFDDHSSRVVKNCVFYNCTADFAASYAGTATNNATTKSSGLPGTSNVYDVISSDFVDTSTKDFHLASGSSLIGSGTDLSGDFTTDIDGDTRSSWDIGFDEYVSAGTTVEADITAAITASVASSNVLTAAAQMAASLSAGYTASGVASAFTSVSAAINAGYIATKSAIINAQCNYQITSDYAATATITAGGSIDADISAGTTVGANAAANAAANAGVSAGSTLSASAVANATANAGISAGVVGDVSMVATIIASGSVEAAISISATVNASATAEAIADASATMSINMGVQAIADALANAGITVGTISNVTFSGSIISSTVTTPDGRTLFVAVEVRTMTITADDRTLYV